MCIIYQDKKNLIVSIIDKTNRATSNIDPLPPYGCNEEFVLEALPVPKVDGCCTAAVPELNENESIIFCRVDWKLEKSLGFKAATNQNLLPSLIVNTSRTLISWPDEGIVPPNTISWAGSPPRVVEFDTIRVKLLKDFPNRLIAAPVHWSSEIFRAGIPPLISTISDAVGEMNVTISSEVLFCDSLFTQLDGYFIAIPLMGFS
jgi:hypothetical protein